MQISPSNFYRILPQGFFILLFGTIMDQKIRDALRMRMSSLKVKSRIAELGNFFIYENRHIILKTYVISLYMTNLKCSFPPSSLRGDAVITPALIQDTPLLSAALIHLNSTLPVSGNTYNSPIVEIEDLID
ncbi:Adhesion G protein-coupled receptor F4 [Galemys pyrenaicus]|uniref:Adhesion G protein-coupled receptor F4 n=1 Tax=Galemys pyrenaicus TaxID=202257 RepID=A0A8J6A5P7_GALPY|nr:Adhesion G protein-coupled receptor F4 [Galemys pyrenaicus]